MHEPTRPPPLIVDVSFAARRPWVPRRGEFGVWAEAAWGAVVAGAGASPAHVGRGGAFEGERVLLEIRVVGGAASRRLNARYRGKDHPTNVLSFAGAGLGPEGWHLGELVICAPVMEIEARRLAGSRVAGDGAVEVEARRGGPVVADGRGAGRASWAAQTRRAHWAHITVHGVLHLAGFDHEAAAAARKMAGLEVQILDRLGFSDPYA